MVDGFFLRAEISLHQESSQNHRMKAALEILLLVNLGYSWCKPALQALSTARAVQSISTQAEVSKPAHTRRGEIKVRSSGMRLAEPALRVRGSYPWDIMFSSIRLEIQGIIPSATSLSPLLSRNPPFIEAELRHCMLTWLLMH